MSASARPVRTWMSFRRIVDIPFGTCVAALDSGELTGHDGSRAPAGSWCAGPSRTRIAGPAGSRSACPAGCWARRYGCGCRPTTGPPPRRGPLWNSSPAGPSGPVPPTSGPATGCWTSWPGRWPGPCRRRARIAPPPASHTPIRANPGRAGGRPGQPPRLGTGPYAPGPPPGADRRPGPPPRGQAGRHSINPPQDRSMTWHDSWTSIRI